MHEDWDPVMLDEYLRGLVEHSSRSEITEDEATTRRRSVLTRSLMLPDRVTPTVDIRRERSVIDLSFG